MKIRSQVSRRKLLLAGVSVATASFLSSCARQGFGAQDSIDGVFELCVSVRL